MSRRTGAVANPPSSRALPPARERNRNGIRPFSAGRPPEPNEALFDKIVVRFGGSVHARDEQSLREFAAHIGSSRTADDGNTARLFGSGSWRGGKWTARVVRGTTISSGELQLHRRPDRAEAGIDVHLFLNPMRTLEHLLKRHHRDDLAGLTSGEFFRESAEARQTAATLDGNDNMLSDFVAFAGTTQTALVQRVASYLALFEAALKGRILQELCPREQGYDWADDCGDLVASNGETDVRLRWSDISVSECEVCWERFLPTAREVVHRLGEGVLLAARNTEVQTFGEVAGGIVSREQGAVSVTLPIVRGRENIELQIYAKAADRLRLEVRYRSEIPQDIRERLPAGPRTLVRWMNALREDAATRLHWASISRMLEPSEDAALNTLLDFTEAVAAATRSVPAKRRTLMRDLLTFGAVTATGPAGTAPSGILKRLARRGVVEHIRFLARDPEIGRRYVLTARFSDLPRLLGPLEEEPTHPHSEGTPPSL